MIYQTNQSFPSLKSLITKFLNLDRYKFNFGSKRSNSNAHVQREFNVLDLAAKGQREHENNLMELRARLSHFGELSRRCSMMMDTQGVEFAICQTMEAS
jgi:hypothetical protein